MSNTVFKIANPVDGFARRFAFASAPTWAELAGKLESTYGIRKDDVCVSYVDSDGDEIVLSSDAELKEYFEEYAPGGNVGQGDDSVRATRFTVMSLSTIRGGEEGVAGRDSAPDAEAFAAGENAPAHADADEHRNHLFANEEATAEIENDAGSGTSTVSSIDSDAEDEEMFFLLPFVGRRGRGRGHGHFGRGGRGHPRAFGGRGGGGPHHNSFHGHHHHHRRHREPRGSGPVPYYHFMAPPNMPFPPLGADAVPPPPPPPPFGMFGRGREGHHGRDGPFAARGHPHGRGGRFAPHEHARGRGGRFAPHEHARGRGGMRGHPYFQYRYDFPPNPFVAAHVPPFPPHFMPVHGGFMMEGVQA